MFSSFLSNFEDFINASELDELENIAGYSLIKDLGNKLNPKTQFLNQGVNSKELILFFLIKMMDDVKEHFSDYNGDVTIELIELFERFSHLRMKWDTDPVNNTVHANPEHGNKRQLSVKSRGTYYTPKFMSEFMCKESVQEISELKTTTLEDLVRKIGKIPTDFQLDQLIEALTIRVVDLSMGIGNFLCDAIPALMKHLLTFKKIILDQLIPLLSKTDSKLVLESIPFCKKLSERKECELLGEFIVDNCLYGIEIDPKIHKIANIIVSLKIESVLGYRGDLSQHLICKNTIITLYNSANDAAITKKVKKLNGFIFKEQFQEVFSQNNDGFDIVIGNPLSWEILKPNNREFFSNYLEDFLQLNRTKQDEFQSHILKNKAILKVFKEYNRYIMSQTDVIPSLGYSHQSSHILDKTFTGDPQLFKFFLEIAFNVVKNKGIISLIVQHNFLGSKSCANLRKLYVNNGKFNGIWEFYNRGKDETYFQNVDPNQRFIVFQFQKQKELKSNINYKKCHSIEEMNRDFHSYHSVHPDFYYEVSNEELQLFGFESKDHLSVFEKLLATHNDLSNLTWKKGEMQVKLSQDLHVTRDRDKFSTEPTSISIYGGRSFGPYYFQPIKERFLIENTFLGFHLPKKSIICRNILPNSAKRIIFSLPPEDAIVDNSCTRLFLEGENEFLLQYILSTSNTLLVEFYLRTILTGMNLNYYLIRRIPFPSIAILSDKRNADLISHLFELSRQLPKIPLETMEWAQIYAEIEAIIAFLFKLTKNELKVILDSFDFSKLQKTTLSGYKPFQELTKKLILDYFEPLSSRLT